MKTKIKTWNYLQLMMGVLLLINLSCKKEPITPGNPSPSDQTTESLPTVTTNDVTNIYSMNATCGGNVSSDGNCSVTSRGVCWNITGNPILSGDVGYTINGYGTGSFSSSMMGLSDNQTYYVRAYATNCKGTAYGNEKVFKTVVRKIVVTVTNLNTSQGDEPSISESSNGSNFKKVGFNSSVSFGVDYSDQNLYIWSCSAGIPCYWKQYSIPYSAGTYIDYLEGARKIRIYRERG